MNNDDKRIDPRLVSTMKIWFEKNDLTKLSFDEPCSWSMNLVSNDYPDMKTAFFHIQHFFDSMNQV